MMANLREIERCPYQMMIVGMGNPRLCGAFLEYKKEKPICLLEHTDICKILERIKEE